VLDELSVYDQAISDSDVLFHFTYNVDSEKGYCLTDKLPPVAYNVGIQ